METAFLNLLANNLQIEDEIIPFVKNYSQIDRTPCFTINQADESFIKRRYVEINNEQYIRKRYNCDLWINIWCNNEKQRHTLIKQINRRILEAEANHYSTCKHYNKQDESCTIIKSKCEALTRKIENGRTIKKQCPNLKNYTNFFKTNHIIKKTFKINSITDLDELTTSEATLRTIFRLNLDYYQYYKIGGQLFDEYIIKEKNMTSTNNKTNDAPKKTASSNKKTATNNEKRILYEAVQENPTRNFIITGALTQAGLIHQYNYEESIYGKETIEPSITIDELNKIIKKYQGD